MLLAQPGDQLCKRVGSCEVSLETREETLTEGGRGVNCETGVGSSEMEMTEGMRNNTVVTSL